MTADPFAASAGAEGVPSAFAAARDTIDALLRDRGLRRRGPEVTAESLLRGAAASAALEGCPFDPATVRAEAAALDPVAAGCLRLSTQLLGGVQTFRSAPLQALARWHAVAATGVVPETDLGRPVEPGGAARLHALAVSLAVPTEAPALVVAAIVHAEVATAAAFGAFDGVLARAAERVVMVARGVDPASVTVPEAGHWRLEPAYRAALDAYRGGTNAGVTHWLLHAAAAYTEGVAVAAEFAG
ncbi:MAG: oxidoreductase [Nocardioidaceae bacterium]